MYQLNQNKIFIPKIIIWYYRIIGITFGGIILKNNKFETNTILKYYSFGVVLIYVAFGLFGNYIIISAPEFKAVYDSGLPYVYYLFIFVLLLSLSQILVNVWFLQCNGLQIVELFQKLGLG